MEPSNKKKLKALKDDLDWLAGLASVAEDDGSGEGAGKDRSHIEGSIEEGIRIARQVIDDVLKSEENKNTKKGELNTARDLYLMRWVLDECDEERLGITNPSTLDDEELQDLLDSAISAWDGGAR